MPCVIIELYYNPSMKKLMGILGMLAFVVTTTAPSLSHATMTHSATAAQEKQTTERHDCHKHGAAKTSEKTAQNDKESSDKCCDKGVCKCIGGTCHSLSKIFGNSGILLSVVAAGEAKFAFANESAESALAERLKRPPKA